MLPALGIDREGRQILAVEPANRESPSSWKDLLVDLNGHGLSGVEFVIADGHVGLRRAIEEVLPEPVRQRSYVHFLRKALDYAPRKAHDACLHELHWLYDRRDVAEARPDRAAWLQRWQATDPRLCGWMEANIEPTLSFCRLPRQHREHLKSTSRLERLNEEIRRRTRVVKLFPNLASWTVPTMLPIAGTRGA